MLFRIGAQRGSFLQPGPSWFPPSSPGWYRRSGVLILYSVRVSSGRAEAQGLRSHSGLSPNHWAIGRNEITEGAASSFKDYLHPIPALFWSTQPPVAKSWVHGNSTKT